jgi:hypothetical protein
MRVSGNVSFEVSNIGGKMSYFILLVVCGLGTVAIRWQGSAGSLRQFFLTLVFNSGKVA